MSADVFTVLGSEVIFYEDWETGTVRPMWTRSSSTTEGYIEVIEQINGLDAFFRGLFWIGDGKDFG